MSLFRRVRRVSPHAHELPRSAEFQTPSCRRKPEKIGGLDVEVGETEPSENVTGYRNKVQQPLGFDGKEAFTGFFRTGTHDIVRVKRCLLQRREARQAAEIFAISQTAAKSRFTTKKQARGF